MDAYYRRSMKNRACFCDNCKQGILSKEQYTDQIRVLCSQSRTSRAKSETVVTTTRKSPRKTNISNFNFDNDVKLIEKTVSKSGLVPDKYYYIDEEQPADLESYNLMVNGTLGDPRILPAVVDTIKYLRYLYHQLLMQAKCRSSSFCDREMDNFRSKGSDSYSSDDLSSGEFSFDKPQYLEHERVRVKKSAIEKSTSNSGVTNAMSSHRQLRKSGKPNEISKDRVHGESDGRDSDSGIHFDCDAFESKICVNNRLHEAAKDGDVEKVIELILDCCDVNGLNGDGWPAIESALNNSKFRAALLLIEAGTDMRAYTEKKVDEYEEVINKARDYTHFIRTAV